MKMKKLIVYILIPIFLCQILGCYSSQTVMRDEALNGKNRVFSVELKNGANIEFNNKVFQFGNIDCITGIDTSGNSFKYSFPAIFILYKTVPELIPLNSYNPHGNDYLVTNDNKLFIFDNNPPYINTSQKIIAGYSANEKAIILPLKKIRGFYKNIPDTISLYGFRHLDSSAVKCLVTINDNNAMHLIYPNKNGCKYYQQKEAIAGFSNNGENKIIDINDIKSYKIEKFDTVLTFTAIIIPIGFLAFIIYEGGIHLSFNLSGSYY